MTGGAERLAGQRIVLHSGMSGGTKFVMSGCLLATAVLLVPILGVITWLFVSLLSPAAGVIAGVLVTVAFVALLLGRMVWILRSAAWLDHTTLSVRGMFVTRRCDLAKAERFTLDSVAEVQPVPMPAVTVIVPTGRRIPRLTTHDVPSGRRVRLRLFDPAAQEFLPPWKLQALADAIAYGRGQEPGAAQTWQVAGSLRAMSGMSGHPGNPPR